MKKLGFTLLEVLIVLAIIGVIIVLVLPSFMENIANKTNATVVKSVYADMTKAYQQALLDNGVRKVSDLDMDQKDFVKKYFDVVNSCDESPTPCFASSYKTITGNDIGLGYVEQAGYYATLSNGAAIGFEFGHVFIDANGKKAPNIVGRDLFAINFDEVGEYEPLSSDEAAACAENGDPMVCFHLLSLNDWDADSYMKEFSYVSKKKVNEFANENKT